MAEPWEALKDEILSLMKESLKDLADEVKEDANAFLEDIAIQAAKEKWRSLNASDPNERAVAESNLRHLRGQSVAEMKRLELALSDRAEGLFEKILDVSLGFLIKIAPALLAAV